MKHTFTYGDFRHMVTGDLYKAIEDVVVRKQDYEHPYYIQVQIRNRYTGAPAVSQLSHGIAVSPTTEDVNLEGKKIIHTRLVLMNRPPHPPQLGTMLWKVDNKKGFVKILYAIPADKPNAQGDSDNFGQVSKLAAESIDRLGVPLVFN